MCVDVRLALQAGVSKLNEARELVDNLNRKAGEQTKVLAEKQEEADQSLKEITFTMQVRHVTYTTLSCCHSRHTHTHRASIHSVCVCVCGVQG